MTAYRRVRIPGATYFFTVALDARGSDLLVAEIDALRGAYLATWRERPFRCEAMVVLPDHLHAVWTLPGGDADYATRWGAIKFRFTRRVKTDGNPATVTRSSSKRRKGDAGIWQRRFWEHCIRDEADFAAHVAYCWGNPVKHGLAERAADWPYSSIHRDIRAGRVEVDWVGKG